MTPLRSFSSATASRSGRLHGIRALHALAELELIDHEALLGIELAILDVIRHVDRQLALLDLVAREAAGVGRDGGHLHALEAHLHVGEQRGGQQVDLAVDLRGRVAIHLAFELRLSRATSDRTTARRWCR